jgi:hypothetical protein
MMFQVDNRKTANAITEESSSHRKKSFSNNSPYNENGRASDIVSSEG